MDKAAIKPTIYEHPEFATFIAGMNAHLPPGGRTAPQRSRACKPAAIRRRSSPSSPKTCSPTTPDKPLIDQYDVYQHLMDYWAETMQDDCYLIAADGWKAETYRIIEKDKKGKEKDKGWTCDLVPKPLIVARYFAEEQAAIDELEAELESVSRPNDRTGRGTRRRGRRLRRAGQGEQGQCHRPAERNQGATAEAKDEAAALNAWLKLSNRGSRAQESAERSRGRLDAAAYAKYPKLTEAEIKTLVVDDKWLAALAAAIHGEMDRISQRSPSA